MFAVNKSSEKQQYKLKFLWKAEQLQCNDGYS